MNQPTPEPLSAEDVEATYKRILDTDRSGLPTIRYETLMFDALALIHTLEAVRARLAEEVESHRKTAKQLVDAQAVEGSTAKRLAEVERELAWRYAGAPMANGIPLDAAKHWLWRLNDWAASHYIPWLIQHHKCAACEDAKP